MDPLIPRLGLALAIGLLVGLERGWRERDAPSGSRTAGIRTFGISPPSPSFPASEAAIRMFGCRFDPDQRQFGGRTL